jgi:hypothetical protein
MLGRPPTGQPVELAAIVIFRISAAASAPQPAPVTRPGPDPAPGTASMLHRCRDCGMDAPSMSYRDGGNEPDGIEG